MYFSSVYFPPLQMTNTLICVFCQTDANLKTELQMVLYLFYIESWTKYQGTEPIMWIL